ncbi:hypothetical protein A4D02_30845 [Niastella koreensis]|uniref:Flagellar FliJ protein n=2 Tax=Niastella koreensis TaxID=354356 RepID=G8T8Y1_NIAKG|nr:hypothetical protein [Niastella koreensis]AEW02338.1 hypothetical protein Niako_6113 [Niastella koreensis GR20-10]OQP46441.1 hypothetical protein A4D02_30845 [Niastella koreensis]
MSVNNNAMHALLERQEQEQKHLAAAAQMAWEKCREVGDQLLSPYNGEYENAPKDVKKMLSQLRQNYMEEWSSIGKLTNLMKERHEREREELVRKNLILEKLRQAKENNRNKSRDRER